MGGAEHTPIEQDRQRKAQGQDARQQAAQRMGGAGGMAAYILQLQRTIGNRAVGQWLRQVGAKPAAPPPGPSQPDEAQELRRTVASPTSDIVQRMKPAPRPSVVAKVDEGDDEEGSEEQRLPAPPSSWSSAAAAASSSSSQEEQRRADFLRWLQEHRQKGGEDEDEEDEGRSGGEADDEDEEGSGGEEADEEGEHWTDRARRLMDPFFPLDRLRLVVRTQSMYIQNPTPGSKAVYLPPGKKNLTKAGKELVAQRPGGAIVLSKDYVEQLGDLPEEEAVAALTSTVRHELRHAANFAGGLVEADNDEQVDNLDEVIAHSENILNMQMGGRMPDEPLWAQIDNLFLAEEYLEKAPKPKKNSDEKYKALYQQAKQAYEAAKKKLDSALAKFNEPEGLQNTYLSATDPTLLGPFSPPPTLADKSRAMADAIKADQDKAEEKDEDEEKVE